jgi:hypothetical protein
MSMPAPGSATSYTVTGQVERDQIQSAGPPVRGVQITYQTGKGNTGSVWVPYAQYNQGPDAVAPLILAAAARMDQIGSLSQ